MDNNLVEPLWFETPAEANRYCKLHGCSLCFGQLLVRHEGGKAYIYCANCGDAYEHTTATRDAIHQAERNISVAMMELRAFEKPPRPEAEILKELGF